MTIYESSEKQTINIPSEYKQDLQKRKGLETMKHKTLCTIKSTIYYAGFKGSLLNGHILADSHVTGV